MATTVASERAFAPVHAVVAITLSLAAGATDAFAFQALGGIFTANMTGNLVLTTLFQRPGYAGSLVGALVAIAVFAAALAAGFELTRAAPRGRVVSLLGAATGLQALVLVGWLRHGPDTALALQCALVACSAGAMALQTVVGRRVSSFAGVTTTYVTGTITASCRIWSTGGAASAVASSRSSRG
jgi:uncharacterized membrane protein YoaK (UPF0700 family)